MLAGESEDKSNVPCVHLYKLQGFHYEEVSSISSSTGLFLGWHNIIVIILP